MFSNHEHEDSGSRALVVAEKLPTFPRFQRAGAVEILAGQSLARAYSPAEERLPFRLHHNPGALLSI